MEDRELKVLIYRPNKDSNKSSHVKLTGTPLSGNQASYFWPSRNEDVLKAGD